MTSLSRQLSRLRAPQTSAQKEKKGSVSFLYDFLEAKSIDGDTHYTIAVSGLQSLIQLDASIDRFGQTLFNESSKTLDRGLQSSEANQELNREIELFLFSVVSKYFLLSATHKTIEWLIYRYGVHQYNTDALIASTLSYHETRLFARLLQTCADIRVETSHWFWLNSVQKSGSPLPKVTLITHCISEPTFLRFICDNLLKCLKIDSKNNNFLTFFVSVIINVIERKINETTLAMIVPIITKGLKSKNNFFRKASLCLCGHICSRVQLDPKIMSKVLKAIAKRCESWMCEEILLTLAIIERFQVLEVLPKKLIACVSNENLIECNDKYETQNLIALVLKSLIRDCTQVSSSQKLVSLVDKLSLTKDLVDTIVQTIGRVDELENNRIATDTFTKLFSLLEIRCPLFLDNSLSKLNSISPIVPFLNEFRYSLLKESKIPLIFGLSHSNQTIQIEAIDYLVKNFDLLIKERDKSSVNDIKSHLSSALTAKSSPQTLITVFGLKEKMFEIFSEEEIRQICLNLLTKCVQKEYIMGDTNISWYQLKNSILATYCSKPCEDLFLVYPYLLPTNEYDFITLSIIINSNFGKQQEIIKRFRKRLKKLIDIEEGVPDLVSVMALITSEMAMFYIENPNLIKPSTFMLSPQSVDYNKSCVLSLAVLERIHCLSSDPEIKQKSANTLLGLIEVMIKSFKTTKIKKVLETIEDFLNVCVKSLEKSKSRINTSIIIFCINSLIETIDWPKTTTDNSIWFWFKQRDCDHFLYKLFYLIFNNCYDKNSSKSEEFRNLLFTLTENIFKSVGYDFFAPLWTDSRSLLRQSRSLAVSCRLSKTKIRFSPTTSLCSLIAMRSSLSSSRESAAVVVEHLNGQKTKFDKLLAQCVNNTQQIISNEEVISQVVADYLSSHSKTEIQPLTKDIFNILDDDNCPEDIKFQILLLLNKCKFLLRDILTKMNGYLNLIHPNKNQMKTIESLISFYKTENVFQEINSQNDIVFTFFIKSLKINFTNQMALNLIDKTLFNGIQSKELKIVLFNELLNLIIEKSDKNSHKKVKKLLNCGDLISSLLTSLVPTDEPINGCEPKAKRLLLSDSKFTLESSNWTKFIILLEIIATKKHLTNTSLLVKHLFYYLKKTFVMEAKSSLEYLRQLILKCLINCIKQTEDDLPFAQIESVIECLRESQHKETQRIALSLISSVANKYKKEILDYVITIFTFIGNNFLQCDDQYSIQIVFETMESIIPILLTNANESKNLVINVFIDSLPDIPAHRRLSLLTKLLTILGESQHLAFVFIKVIERIFNKSKAEKEPFLILMSALSAKCGIDVQIEAINRLMDVFANEFTLDFAVNSDSMTDQSYSVNDRRLIAQSLAQMILNIVSSQDFIQTTQKSEWNQISEQLLAFLHRLILLIVKFNVTENESLKETDTNRRRIRNLLHQILLRFNSLLPNKQLVDLFLKLLTNDSILIKRKALEMLNEKLEEFRNQSLDTKLTHKLLVCLSSTFPTPETINQLDEPFVYNTQLVMITIKLLSKHISGDDRLEKIVFELLERMISLINAMKKDISINLKASCILCLTQLMTSLANKAIPLIPSILPIILDNFNASDEVVIISLMASVSKISQNFSQFLSQYLTQIIVKLLTVCNKYPDLKVKLKTIWNTFSKMISKRVILESIDSSFDEVKRISFESVIDLMSLLKLTFENMTSKSDVNAVDKFVRSLLLKSLDLRNQNQSQTDMDVTTAVEDAVNEAFSVFVPKLTETTFRPILFKLYDWAIRDKSGHLYLRMISFYRFIQLLAHKLKNLFCVFVGPSVVNNCAEILSAFHSDNSLRNDLKLDDQTSNLLIVSIVSTLSNCFLYDSDGTFLTNDRMQALAKPLVNQLSNTLGTKTNFDQRVETLSLCTKNLIESNKDERVIKHFNYEILLQTRHSSSDVRLAALRLLHRMILTAGEDYLPIIPETIPFISELSEDDSNDIEDLVKTVVTDLEQIMGEPIAKYL